ncbi:AAA family ATPase [Nocardiopsis dassonvillei]|uniref:AAA family ATPase n=1 Tax=Nocardiopsis dassonvillei TaxID=2014 RepID=UPI000A6AC842|nr:AAA family ATPase [Nocardiopsis dassonvillei]
MYKGIDLVAINVSGLFGLYDHSILLSRDSKITIVAGANGIGKTHLIKIAHSVLNLDFESLVNLPYCSAVLVFSDEKKIKVERFVAEGGEVREGVEFSLFDKEGSRLDWQFFSSEEVGMADESSFLPPYVRRVGSNTWLDERSGLRHSNRTVERMYSISLSTMREAREISGVKQWIKALNESYKSNFIETKRLEYPVIGSSKDDAYLRSSRFKERDESGPVVAYINRIEEQITHARRASLRKSQIADRKFVNRLIESSDKDVEQSYLVDTYEELSRLNDDLSLNGLSLRSATVQIPDNANSTQRVVLDVFLQDWRTKLEPFLPVHRKIETLKGIVNSKFIGKKLEVGREGDVSFRSKNGARLRVNQLSSGEQHILALFTLLLFDSEPGAIVFIDEPEISLHAAWKHSFVDDLEEVSKVSSVSVVMATHSTAIVNGRWDLVQELETPHGD